jgi:5-dehydro-2-deoxygluconokinase
VCVDLDYRPDQWYDARAFGLAVRALVRSAHLAIGTEEEVRTAGGTEQVTDAAAKLFESGIEALVLKRGAEGAIVQRANGAPTKVPPFQVKILNVLGAGDAFASGLIYGLTQGWPLERAVEFGNATGAIVVTRHGCANFMPTLNEVNEFVASQGGWSWARQSA